MPSKTFFLIAILIGVGCTPPGKAPSMVTATTHGSGMDSTRDIAAIRTDVHWHVLETDPSTVIFDTGDTMRTHASNLRLIDKVASPLGKPWFLFSGNDKDDTDEALSLYVVSPGDSLDHGVQRSWHMPGRLLDSDGKEYYNASVFAGEVLRDTVGVVWYDKSLMPDGQWRSNTTILQLDRPEPDTLVFFGQGRKSISMDLAFRGACRVLQGIDQKATSR